MSLIKFGNRLLGNFSIITKTPSFSFRNINTSSSLRLKEIKEEKSNNALIISGEFVKSPRENLLLKECQQANFCPTCTLGLNIKHTDVLILSQYVRSDGCMLPKRITGLCSKQQKRMGRLVTMAQKSGLMPNLAPSWSKRDPTKRYQWKKYNKYYNEDTILFKKKRIIINEDNLPCNQLRAVTAPTASKSVIE